MYREACVLPLGAANGWLRILAREVLVLTQMHAIRRDQQTKSRPLGVCDAWI